MGLFSKNEKSIRNKESSVVNHTMPLPSQDHNPLDARLQLLTGKGGVGRTTAAITLAQAYADQGETVLLLEARDAEDELQEIEDLRSRQDSMLGRALALALDEERAPPRVLSAEPSLIRHNLWAAQLVATVGHAAFLRSIIPSHRLVKAALESKPLSKFLRSAPSMHELGLFYHLKGFEEDSKFQKIVIDLPATGHTLALSQLPDKIAKIIKKGQIVEALKAGVAHMADPQETSLWVVTLPETLPVTEAIEVAEALTADGIEPAGVICNRCLARELTSAEQYLLRPLDEGINEQGSTAMIESLLDTLFSKVQLSDQDAKKLDIFKKKLRLPEMIKHQDRVQYVLQEWSFGGHS